MKITGTAAYGLNLKSTLLSSYINVNVVGVSNADVEAEPLQFWTIAGKP